MAEIGLLNLKNPSKRILVSKDLNGGLGTADVYQTRSLFGYLLGKIKSKGVNIPVSVFGFIQSILKNNGYSVEYHEGSTPQFSKSTRYIFVYGSLVECEYENSFVEELKEAYKSSVLIVFGPYPSRYPEKFKKFDIVVDGEIEAFFLYDFHENFSHKGVYKVSKVLELNDLPIPDLSGMPIEAYGYYPALEKKPFYALYASRGCPYSCSYYCTYGEYQGTQYRVRSEEKVAEDMKELRLKYGIKAIQFRDATFGLKPGYMEKLSQYIIQSGVRIEWGIETRVELLTIEKLKLMRSAGLNNINIGIETVNENLAKNNFRGKTNKSHQEEIIYFCKSIGINVSAFFIFGLSGDNEEEIEGTIQYAKKLNVPLVRFSISTPYPGTKYFDDLIKQEKLIDFNFQNYNQFSLVFKHDNFSKEKLEKKLDDAYRRYYFNFKYIITAIFWRIKRRNKSLS